METVAKRSIAPKPKLTRAERAVLYWQFQATPKARQIMQRAAAEIRALFEEELRAR